MSLKRITALLIALYNTIRRQLQELKDLKTVVENKNTINSQVYVFDQSTSKWIPLTSPVPVNAVDYKNSSQILQLLNDQYNVQNNINTNVTDIKNYIPYILQGLDQIYNAIYDKTNSISTISSLETITKSMASAIAYLSYIYDTDYYVFDRSSTIMAQLKDFTNIRSSGRFVTVLDFSKLCDNPEIYNHQLYTIHILGDLVSSTPVKWNEEGLPPPENDYSEYVLKITIKGNGSIKMVVPARARPYRPFLTYLCLLSPSGNIRVNPYVTLGSDPNQVRNKLPTDLIPVAGKWARFINHWFTEFHHGLANFVIDITNTSSNEETVYIGMISVGELERFTKGFELLHGFEDNYQITISNTNLDINYNIMIPLDDKPCALLLVDVGITGSGSADIYLSTRGLKLASASVNGTVPVYCQKMFKVLLNSRNIINYNTLGFTISLSTTSTLNVIHMTTVLFGLCEPYYYSKFASVSVNAGSTTTFYDALSNFSQIRRVKLWTSGSLPGEVTIYGVFRDKTDTIAKLPANFSNSPDNPIIIEGLYDKIEIYNSASSSATINGIVELIDAITPY